MMVILYLHSRASAKQRIKDRVRGNWRKDNARSKLSLEFHQIHFQPCQLLASLP